MKKHLLLLQKIMRHTLLVYCAIIACSQLLFAESSNGQALDKRINISFKRENLLNVIEQLRLKSGVDFAYDPAYLNLRKIKVGEMDFDQKRISSILMSIFQETDIVFREEVPGMITLLRNQEPGKISGKIVDEKGLPLPGATIKVLELNAVVQSNVNGTYSISAAPGLYTLVVSYISYGSVTQTKVNVKAGETTS